MAQRIPIPIHTTPGVSTGDMIAMLIHTGALKVTRCPEMRRPKAVSTVGRKGGAVPSYLNPLLMGHTLAELEEQARA